MSALFMYNLFNLNYVNVRNKIKKLFLKIINLIKMQSLSLNVFCFKLFRTLSSEKSIFSNFFDFFKISRTHNLLLMKRWQFVYFTVQHLNGLDNGLCGRSSHNSWSTETTAESHQFDWWSNFCFQHGIPFAFDSTRSGGHTECGQQNI